MAGNGLFGDVLGSLRSPLRSRSTGAIGSPYGPVPPTGPMQPLTSPFTTAARTDLPPMTDPFGRHQRRRLPLLDVFYDVYGSIGTTNHGGVPKLEECFHLR